MTLEEQIRNARSSEEIAQLCKSVYVTQGVMRRNSDGLVEFTELPTTQAPVAPTPQRSKDEPVHVPSDFESVDGWLRRKF